MEDSKQCRGAGAQDKRSHRHPVRRGEARLDRTWRISAGGSGHPAQSPDNVAFLPAIRNLASDATAIECHFLLPGDAVNLLIRKLIETLSGDANQHGGTISQVKLRGMDKDRLWSRSRPRSFDRRTSRSISGVFATKCAWRRPALPIDADQDRKHRNGYLSTRSTGFTCFGSLPPFKAAPPHGFRRIFHGFTKAGAVIMKISRITAIIAIATLAAGPLYAQDKAASSSAAGKQAMMDECAKEHGKHHDHAAEKGASGMKAKCMDEKMRGKQAAKKPLHDHNKEHKAN